jgi:hypothetical protein
VVGACAVNSPVHTEMFTTELTEPPTGVGETGTGRICPDAVLGGRIWQGVYTLLNKTWVSVLGEMKFQIFAPFCLGPHRCCM